MLVARLFQAPFRDPAWSKYGRTIDAKSWLEQDLAKALIAARLGRYLAKIKQKNWCR